MSSGSGAVTVTVYFCVELSAAVTVYSTGFVKFCATPVFGDILAPVCVMVGTSAVKFVPYGTVNAIFLFPSSTVPVTFGFKPLKLKAVIATVLSTTISPVCIAETGAHVPSLA